MKNHEISFNSKCGRAYPNRVATVCLKRAGTVALDVAEHETLIGAGELLAARWSAAQRFVHGGAAVSALVCESNPLPIGTALLKSRAAREKL